MTTAPITGLHHVTALAGAPDINLRFYTRALGLRLVKKTVNFDDPFTYHLYYGDAAGSPGTLITHFPHPRARAAVRGTQEIDHTILAVPDGSLSAWRDALHRAGANPQHTDALGVPALTFTDPDTMRFYMVERPPAPSATAWDRGPVPGAPIQRVLGVTLRVLDAQHTIDFLTRALGFIALESRGPSHRLTLPADGSILDVIHDPAAAHAHMGAGSVHHVAWRVPSDDAQSRAAAAIAAAGIAVTPVRDRNYFRSIYFRIPGGIIFEIATDAPGFDADEPRDTLGAHLKLPPQFEPMRAKIEAALPPIRVD